MYNKISNMIDIYLLRIVALYKFVYSDSGFKNDKVAQHNQGFYAETF